MSALNAPAFLWQSRLLGRSGYATLARQVLQETTARGWDVAYRHFSREPEADPETRQSEWYRKRLDAPIVPGSPYIAFHTAASQYGSSYFHEAREMNPGHGHYIGYTMFETDRIPALWREACEAMDEIWVPTHFNRETFARSGVPVEKIHVMPFGIDPERFDPAKRRPFGFATEKKFVFLSAFEWSMRKGWDALLRAYAEEFRRDESVCLVLSCHRGEGINPEQRALDLSQEIDRFLKDEVGIPRAQAPEILLLEERIPDDRWADLFASANAFVLPTRGEGWGVPFTEAAISGLPILATAWGAQLEYLDAENSYLVDIEGLREVGADQLRDSRLFAGHRWAQPSCVSLRRQLRRVFECREEAKRKGETARERMCSSFTVKHCVDRIERRLREVGETPSVPALSVPAAFGPRRSGPFRMLWVGENAEEEGLNLLLACYCAAFQGQEDVELLVAAASPASARDIEETVKSFLPLSKASIRFAGIAGDAKRLWLDADLFVYPSARVEESARTREAVEQGLCVLASAESAPACVRDSRHGLFLFTKKNPKGLGGSRYLAGRPSANAIARLLAWAVEHREQIRKMGSSAKHTWTESVAASKSRVPLCSDERMESPSAIWEFREIESSPERGDWSGAMNAEIVRNATGLLAICAGKLAPSAIAGKAMEENKQAALYYESTTQGAYVLVRSHRARAYAMFDERFHGLDALREYVRAVRSAGGLALLGESFAPKGVFSREKDDAAIAFLELAESLAARGKGNEAVEAAQKALACKPDYFEAALALARWLLDRQDSASRLEARAHLQNALALRPNDSKALHLFGRAFAEDSAFDRALEFLRVASLFDPENSEIWNDLGVVQGTLGLLQESLESLEKSRRADANNADAWNNGADILEALGELEQARRWRARAQRCAEVL